MGPAAVATEAFALGLSSGPVCLATCAPVLLPVLAVERKAARGTGALLAQFLTGRLAGYLAFACIAWLLGASLSAKPGAQAWAFGLADLAIAALLAGYGFAMRRNPFEKACPTHWARRIASRYSSYASLCLGFASGLSLCPPFVAAGVRAAQSSGLASAMFFFLCFFLGTSVWFAPSVSLTMLRRVEAVGVVARLVLFLLAGYYGYLAIIALGRAYLNG